MAATQQSLGQRLGETFANTWLDASTGKLVTGGVTDVSHISQVRASGALAKVVAHSAAVLNSIKSALDRQAGGAPGSVTGWLSARRRLPV